MGLVRNEQWVVGSWFIYGGGVTTRPRRHDDNNNKQRHDERMGGRDGTGTNQPTTTN